MQLIQIVTRGSEKYYNQEWVKNNIEDWRSHGFNVVLLYESKGHLDKYLPDEFEALAREHKISPAFTLDCLRLKVLRDLSEYDDVIYLDTDVVVDDEFREAITQYVHKWGCGFDTNPGLLCYCAKGFGKRLDRYIKFYTNTYLPYLRCQCEKGFFQPYTDCDIEAFLAYHGFSINGTFMRGYLCHVSSYYAQGVVLTHDESLSREWARTKGVMYMPVKWEEKFRRMVTQRFGDNVIKSENELFNYDPNLPRIDKPVLLVWV